jgi:hypothetical protein
VLQAATPQRVDVITIDELGAEIAPLTAEISRPTPGGGCASRPSAGAGARGSASSRAARAEAADGAPEKVREILWR